MEWVPLYVLMVRSPAMANAPAEAIAAWVRLYAAAAAAENGGRFDGARSWSDRQWMTIAAVTAAEVSTAVAHELATWEGDSLAVRGYPEDAELRARKRSEHAAVAASKRWGNARSNAPSIARSNATGNAQDRTGEDRTGQDTRGEAESAEPSEAGRSPAPAEPALLVFPCAGKIETWSLTESVRAELAEAFPGVDVMACARKALEWCRANPKRIKTAARMRAWLGSTWCAGDQNRGRSPGAQAQTNLRVGPVRAEQCHHDQIGDIAL